MAENGGAMKKALQNPLILQNIFRKLSLSNLLDCRLVNSFIWVDLATEVLCDKNQIKIDFNFSNGLVNGEYFADLAKKLEKCFPAFEIPTENPWSLKTLVNCIKQSRFFPCSRFRLSQVHFDEDDEDLDDFFSFYGEFIIELEIDVMARSDSSKAIRKFGEILWKQLPNLEKLTLWKVSLPWTPFTHLFPKPVRLTAKIEKLKYFSFEKSLVSGKFKFKFIQDIQQAAPNLEQENVQEIPFVPPKAEVHSNLIGIYVGMSGPISQLEFAPETSNIRFYEQLVKATAKFTNIIVDLEKVKKTCDLRILSRVTGILTEILNLSQSTLGHLDGFMAISSLPKIQLNSLKFPHCKLLSLRSLEKIYPEEKEDKEKDKRDEKFLIFNLDLKSTFKMSQSFPSLSQVRFFSLDFIQNYGDSIPTVKIVISDAVFSTPVDFEKLGKIFPNTQELKLYYIRDFQKCAPALWGNFGKVKKLQIGISLDSDSEDVSMDKAFFGAGKNSSVLELGELENLFVSFTPNPRKIGSGFKTRKGKWTRWNFLGASTAQALQRVRKLPAIHVTVDATLTACKGCKDEEKILNQLTELNSCVPLDVWVSQTPEKYEDVKFACKCPRDKCVRMRERIKDARAKK